MEVSLVPILDTAPATQARIREIRNLDNVRRFMYTEHIISESEHAAWLRALKADPHRMVLVIFLASDPVGVASFNNVSQQHQRADWAFYLHADIQGKGVGSVVEYMVLQKAFNELALEKLNCEVLATNLSVIKLHQKFGFAVEGLRRQHVIKGGKRVDVCLLGITREEWFRRQPRFTTLVSRIAAGSLTT